MKQMYVIYVSDHTINVPDPDFKIPASVSTVELGVDADVLLKKIRSLLNRKKITTLWIKSDDPKKLLKNLKAKIKYIRAAGGLVKNPENQYLFIFRRGKWDLPKGKLEMGEKPRQAAIREVEEECGIRIHDCKKKLDATYHIYPQENKLVLKITYWYLMEIHNEQTPVPQAEEDITKAVWFNNPGFAEIMTNTFPSVKEVVSHVHLML